MNLPFHNDRSDTLRGKLVQGYLILVWIIFPVVVVLLSVFGTDT